MIGKVLRHHAFPSLSFNMNLEDIDFSKMSEEELEAFAKKRFRCLYLERKSFDECKFCDGYDSRCAYRTVESHLETFYNLFK